MMVCSMLGVWRLAPCAWQRAGREWLKLPYTQRLASVAKLALALARGSLSKR